MVIAVSGAYSKDAATQHVFIGMPKKDRQLRYENKAGEFWLRPYRTREAAYHSNETNSKQLQSCSCTGRSALPEMYYNMGNDFEIVVHGDGYPCARPEA